jgi:hypothetical protein
MLRLRRAPDLCGEIVSLATFRLSRRPFAQGDECDHRHRNSSLAGQTPATVTLKGYPIANTTAAAAAASASAVPPTSHRSTSSAKVRITTIALGWTGVTTALASVVNEAEQLVLALDGRALRAADPMAARWQAGEGEQGSVLLQRGPCSSTAVRRKGRK